MASQFDPSKSPAEFTGYLEDVLAGKAPYAHLREQLIILGHFAEKAEAQMGQGGRPTADLLMRMWGKMAKDGDADARLILNTLSSHPRLGPLAKDQLALL